MSSSKESFVAHVAFLPSAGLGHLNPCLRTAELFLRYGCKLTLITPKPTISLAESDLITHFCSSFPSSQLSQVDLNLIPLDPPINVNSVDPFWIQFETIRQSLHQLLPSILSTLSLSAFFYDVSLISPLVSIMECFSFPSYIYFIAPARMFSFFAYLSVLSEKNKDEIHFSFNGDVVEIPGIAPIPRSSLPPLILQPNSLFEKILMEDSPKLTKLNGIFMNSFEELEGETLTALNDGRVVPGLPHVHAIGPLVPCEFEKVRCSANDCTNSILKWLDEQAAGSVVYVCLGNKTETKREQIKDMANGYISCGFKFLWVVKLKVVDKEEEENLEDILGNEMMKKVNEKVEAIWHGKPILSWAHDGDQKIASEVVKMSGVGVWPEEWGWGKQDLVKGEDISKAIKEMMSDESLRIKAGKMKEVARKAAGVGGSIEVVIRKQIEEWKINAQGIS
ncbi:unnamed protein product [Vicia faba]|uniref:Uncharacterized protein n=1 Tax=Vicia faba TaxID=3906 RepID=A0AAV0Z9G3_VICFA|nr:unnamed protein product [Vicia faba]